MNGAISEVIIEDAFLTTPISGAAAIIDMGGANLCDLLIIIRSRLSDRVTGNTKHFASQAKIIHIDIDVAKIDKNVVVDLDIVGDAKKVLQELNKSLTRQNHTEWLKEIRKLKERFPMSYNQTSLTGPYVIEQIAYITNSEAIIVTEVGPHNFISLSTLGNLFHQAV